MIELAIAVGILFLGMVVGVGLTLWWLTTGSPWF